MKQRIDVSDEMLAFVGAGPLPVAQWPAGSLGLSFRFADAVFAFSRDPRAAPELAQAELAQAELVFVVAAAACRRIFGQVPDEDMAWHLPTDLRMIALAIAEPQMPASAQETFRLAKSIELLCATFARFADGSLVPLDTMGALSAAEAERIIAANRLIEERWHEKLTLDTIARTCGLNRAKLTRGFRAMFDCSISTAIAEHRLGGARQLLLATDLPVSSIGYRCGYLNNASFTRAFSRRFGVAPTQLRAHRTAA